MKLSDKIEDKVTDGIAKGLQIVKEVKIKDKATDGIAKGLQIIEEVKIKEEKIKEEKRKEAERKAEEERRQEERRQELIRKIKKSLKWVKEKTGLMGSYEKMNKKCKGKFPLYLLVVFVLIMSMAAIGSGSDSDTDSNSDSNTSSVTTESNDATENDETTPEMTAAEIKENTESIDVTYDGETKAGTVLDEKNDGIEVTATLNDDTEKEISDWKVEKAKTLEPEKATKVRIIYGDHKTILEIVCTTEIQATTGEKNALGIAKSYIVYSAFSYKGLIEQLKFEGYSGSEAKFGADNCDADWNEQAALSAEKYMKYSSFSRQGLIEQLEFEGFTSKQATYGVEQNGY